jgi:hypothetical protein
LLRGTAAGLDQRGAGLLQGGACFGVGQPHQQVAGLDAVALAHLDVQHGGGHFAANVHARRCVEPPRGHHRLHDAGAYHR